jgi:sec-independent protein translocase protein TatA
MHGSSEIMNIGGSEWIILGLLIVFLLFGSKKLPEFSRMVGKAMGEYEKARMITQREISESLSALPTDYIGPKIVGPINSEREKLETVAQSLGIEFTNESDDELRKLISSKMDINKVT